MKKYIILLFFTSIILMIIGYSGIFKLLKRPSFLFLKDCQNSTEQVRIHDSSAKQCLPHYFSQTVLAIVYNHPHYDSVSLLREFYAPVFAKIFFCGPPTNESHPDITQIEINRGIFGYECLAQAIRHYHGYDGYFYINDDVILNYWNLIDTKFDKDFIWKSNNQFGKVDLEKEIPPNWYWWISPYGFQNGRQAVNEIEVLSKSFKYYKDLYEIYTRNGNSTKYLHNGRSDILYIPRKYSLKFQEVSRIFHQHKVFLEIALPTILNFLTASTEIYTLNGYYIPGDVRKQDPRVIDSRYFWTLYLEQPDLWFIHPFKLHHKGNKNRALNLALMKHILIAKTKELSKC